MAINQTVYEVEIYNKFDMSEIINAFNTLLPMPPKRDGSAYWTSEFNNEWNLCLRVAIDRWMENCTSNFYGHIISRSELSDKTITIKIDDRAITSLLTDFLLYCKIPYTMKSHPLNLIYVGVIQHCPDYYPEYKNIDYWLNRSDAEAWLATDGITDGYLEAEASIDIKVLK
jgi:hypothetical protein